MKCAYDGKVHTVS